MAEKTPTRTGKGKGLKRKLGPFPVYVYAILVAAIVVGYLYYRSRQQGGTVLAAGSQNQSVIPIAIPSGGQSGASTGSGTADTTGSSVTYPTDYATTTDLQSGLDALGNEVGAQIAGITFPQPNVNITVPPAQVVVQTQKSKAAAKKAVVSKPTKYYTTKKSVPLRAGQTLHFAKGRGYYAG